MARLAVATAAEHPMTDSVRQRIASVFHRTARLMPLDESERHHRLDWLLFSAEKWGLDTLTTDVATSKSESGHTFVLDSYWFRLWLSANAPEITEKTKQVARRVGRDSTPVSSPDVPLDLSTYCGIRLYPLAFGRLSKSSTIRYGIVHLHDSAKLQMDHDERTFALLSDPKDTARFALSSVHSSPHGLKSVLPSMVGHLTVQEIFGHAVLEELQSNIDYGRLGEFGLGLQEPLFLSPFSATYRRWAHVLLKKVIAHYRNRGQPVFFPNESAYSLMHPGLSGQPKSVLGRIRREISTLAPIMGFTIESANPLERTRLNLTGGFQKIVFRPVKSAFRQKSRPA
ncbi:hypothetical protein HY994_00970 [Candidatus Micrarchaeota archaeon]|nr:hypothetical protein [Candidatus Micrarchaeota archaeon]